MMSGARRQGTLLLLIVLAGGIGIGVGEWRRRHPELVDRLERFDHIDPGPAVAAPFRLRAAGRGQPSSASPPPGDRGLEREESLDAAHDHDTPAGRRSASRPEARRRLDAPRRAVDAPTMPRRVPVDLNGASVEALAELPGVGPGLAQAIVATREARGPFASVDDLRWIRGIGPSRLERLRPFLTVSP